MAEKILVSIITVCYNSEKTIRDTIESVLGQTYTKIEYILIDGNSKDRTIEIIKSYESKFEEKGIAYKWISEPDKGIYDAMNKGIDVASGELIGIINSDDWYEINAIESILKNYDEAIDVYHGYLRFIEDEREQMIRRTDSCQLEKGIMIEHPTCFLNKRVYEKNGKYSLDYKSSSDLDYFLNFFKELKFKKVDLIISNFRVDGISNTIIGQLETLEILYKNKKISKKSYFISLIKLKIKKYLV